MNATSPSSLRRVAAEKANATMKNIAARANAGNLVPIDELEFNGAKQSDFITLLLQNDNAAGGDTINFVVGTPLGVADEYAKVPDITVENHFLDNLGDVQDEGGVGAPILQLLNKRLLRKTLVVSQIELLATGTTSEEQKQQKMRQIILPYNIQDGQLKSGIFVAQYTEYTAVSLLTKPISLGDFQGLIYPVLPDQSVQINLYLSGIQKSTFELV